MKAIHYAKLSGSARLRRVLHVLLTHDRCSTMEISRLARVCAVNTAIAELRANGINIDCKCAARGLFYYSIPIFELGCAATKYNNSMKENAK